MLISLVIIVFLIFIAAGFSICININPLGFTIGIIISGLLGVISGLIYEKRHGEE